MRRTKESVPPGDEARGGNWFQMKQEVESGDKERVVSDKGKGGRAPSVDTKSHTHTHMVGVYCLSVKRKSISFFFLPFLYIWFIFFKNPIPSFPVDFPAARSV